MGSCSNVNVSFSSLIWWKTRLKIIWDTSVPFLHRLTLPILSGYPCLGIPVKHSRVNKSHQNKSAKITQGPGRSDLEALVLHRNIAWHTALLLCLKCWRFTKQGWKYWWESNISIPYKRKLPISLIFSTTASHITNSIKGRPISAWHTQFLIK